ncbi:MAG: hypothetical protein V5789_05110 [Colwellia sp.]
MKIQTLKEIEHAIGGRAQTGNRKIRLTFYLSPSETRNLKEHAMMEDKSISEVVRYCLKKVIK